MDPVAAHRPARPATCDGPRLAQAVSALLGPEGPEARFAAALSERRIEADAVTDLLVRGRTPALAPGDVEALARSIAAGCLGERHLWRDLRLSDRALLRELLETYFAPFAAENDRDMRWKKFIYRKLCRWEGFEACRAPSCGACSSFEECFSPED
jgi:nitrogen fixation protein NifQ